MMKLTIAMFFCLSLSLACGDVLTAEDIISVGKFLDERELLESIQNKLIGGDSVVLGSGDWQRLKDAGFSDDFVQKLHSLVHPSCRENCLTASKVADSPGNPEIRYHTISVSIRPQGAGQVVFTPPLIEGQKTASGTEVSLRPEGVAPYLFDHWEGDLNGYYPVRVRLSQDMSIVAVFREPQPEKAPPKIADPEVFRDYRRAGYTYEGEVIGQVEGQGVHKDWGLSGEVNYKYFYHIRCTSDILSNDGYRVCERRTFDSVQESLVISQYRFRIALTEEWEPIQKFLEETGKWAYLSGQALSRIPDPTAQVGGRILQITGTVEGAVARLGDWALAEVEKISFSEERVEEILKGVEWALGEQETTQKLRKYVVNPHIGRILGYPPNMKILEGKSVYLQYEDGVGLVNIVLEDPEQILTAQEKELLQRAFYLSDYYIFRDSENPGRQLKVGTLWNVDARTLAGVLDPRLRHYASGKVQLYRSDDQSYNGKTLACFEVLRGNIQMLPLEKGKNIEGEVNLTKGQILYDLAMGYVVSAELSGIATYREVSKDHFFFEARLSTEPRITVRYQCSCVKTQQ